MWYIITDNLYYYMELASRPLLKHSSMKNTVSANAVSLPFWTCMWYNNNIILCGYCQALGCLYGVTPWVRIRTSQATLVGVYYISMLAMISAGVKLKSCERTKEIVSGSWSGSWYQCLIYIYIYVIIIMYMIVGINYK